MNPFDPKRAAIDFATHHADAVSDLHEATLALRIFESTAYLGSGLGTVKEREMLVQSDPGYKRLSKAVIKARRAVQWLEDGMRAAEAMPGLTRVMEPAE